MGALQQGKALHGRGWYPVWERESVYVLGRHRNHTIPSEIELDATRYPRERNIYR